MPVASQLYSAEGARSVSRSSSATYGRPYLEAVELRALPISEYAAIEDVPRNAWWAPLPGPGKLFRAVEATGATTLAEACQHAAVLDALLRASMRLDQER